MTASDKPFPSASHWDLLSICQAAAAFPWVQERSAALDAGRERHAFYERLGNGLAREAAIAAAPEPVREMLEALPTEGLDVEPGAYQSEVTFFLDPADGRVRIVGAGFGRAAYVDCPPRWIPGTMDRCGVTDEAVVVRDFKSAWDDAGHHWQLGIYSYAAFAWQHRPSVMRLLDRVAAGRSAPMRLSDWDAESAALFASDLEALATRVRRVMEGTDAPTPVVGSHCGRCPARFSCPAQTAQVRALATTIHEDNAGLSTDDFRRIAPMWPAFMARVASFEARLKAEARAAYESGIPFTDERGRQYRPWPAERPSDDALEPILAVLAEFAGHNMSAIERAVQTERKVTVDGLRSFAQSVSPPRESTATYRAIRARLRESGAVTPRTVTAWRMPRGED